MGRVWEEYRSEEEGKSIDQRMGRGWEEYRSEEEGKSIVYNIII